ncbi:hypothetical protein EJ05DRAFT_73046 [Pseudovirgaria hyperparasitica]|uniref:Uncharacterized protein n=1 Tax=Pseudovirgaria hyperparasitica TaxID=470096 RepID=A0A6A6W2A1_9PEZI|nr:uncharacterized protein EJ05DRAFT_73046 [Pseudovirgaria hyperparasitica]KAF2756693.1 hypothetical protein EJ05DRAFT_73046 [Pseudovirgaria hyperparasitica]
MGDYPKVVHNDTKSVEFPVLPLDANWRTKTTVASLADGPIKAIDLKSIPTKGPIEFLQAQATWITLPDDFGATAGLVFTSHNASTTIVRGCSIDARWTPGQYIQGRQANLFAWQPFLGPLAAPDSDATIQLPAQLDLFGPELKDLHSPTLKADQTWLDALAPPSAASQGNDSYTMSTFDTLLNVTVLNNPSFGTESEASINADFPRILLEFITDLYFVDAISRIGLNLQYSHDPATGNPLSSIIDPTLRLPIAGDPPDRILFGGPTFARPPAGFNYTVLHHNWYRYGQAWMLHDYPQYVSAAVLLFTLLLAVLHAGFMLWRAESSDAWDSIAELITLAYNSGRGDNDEGISNAGAGITNLSTLNKVAQVREVSMQRGEGSDGQRKVELVITDRGVHDYGHRIALDQGYS